MQLINLKKYELNNIKFNISNATNINLPKSNLMILINV